VRAGKPAMAACTLRYGRAAFGWAEKRGKVPSNPFQGLPVPAGSAARNRVLNDAEIREVWTSAGTLASPWREFFRLTLLTLQRRREVAEMRWSELANDLGRWTIPGSRMKNGQPHIVHLSEAAREILRTVPRVRGCDYVFSTNSRTPISGISKPKLELDAGIARARGAAAQEADLKPEPLMPWRLHDLRRSGVSWLAGAGCDAIVADKILGHVPRKLSAVARIYQQHDFLRERAAALDTWSRFVTEEPEHPNVLRLIRA
jgi:integrase